MCNEIVGVAAAFGIVELLVPAVIVVVHIVVTMNGLSAAGTYVPSA
jgi:hypothetical protein